MNRLFRKATFGGFNKEDVMQYIETMKTEFFDYKAQVEETIHELNEKLQAFEQSGEASNAPAAVFKTGDPAMSITEATDHLKQVADELCEKMNRLIGILPKQEAAANQEPETPATADDKVNDLLQHLFTGDAAQKPQQSQHTANVLSISDVLPAYLK